MPLRIWCGVQLAEIEPIERMVEAADLRIFFDNGQTDGPVSSPRSPWRARNLLLLMTMTSARYSLAFATFAAPAPPACGSTAIAQTPPESGVAMHGSDRRHSGIATHNDGAECGSASNGPGFHARRVLILVVARSHPPERF
jgi:hypothetical protein